MQKRGVTKTAKGKPTGFSNALQLAKRKKEFSGIRSKPVFKSTDAPLTATSFLKEQLMLNGPPGGSFFCSLFETLLANHVLTETHPESLRQAIASFALINGSEYIAQDFSFLNLLQEYTGKILTMQEYIDWWHDRANDEPRAYIPFVYGCSMHAELSNNTLDSIP
jgi:hypothetical protein